MAYPGDMHSTVYRALDDALGAMNDAVAMTAEKGPAVAIEYIADYLNGRDAQDDELVDRCPEDWLTRWRVERLSEHKHVWSAWVDDPYGDGTSLRACPCGAVQYD